ncbi:MAG: proline dehydrogenase family protein, partial [Elusimicrobiota bacterium]
IVGEAGNLQNFVRVDMEGSGYTQRTLDLFFDVFQSHRNTGIVIQAYLKRSRADIAALCRAGARVRLCKGAYAEPPSVAFETREEVHRRYPSVWAVPLFARRFDLVAANMKPEGRVLDVGAAGRPF